jgi:DNA-binding MarR family transcriptional regulator
MFTLRVMSDSQRILDSIRRLVRMLRVSDRQAQAELGISGAQLFVLTELGRTPSLSLNDLAARTLTDQSSVSVVVTRLVDAGLVTRDRDTRDARRLVLNLTRSGRALLQKAPPVAQQRLLAIFDRLSESERKQFADTFEEIVENIGDEGPAPMFFEDDSAARQQHQLKAVPKKDAAAK